MDLSANVHECSDLKTAANPAYEMVKHIRGGGEGQEQHEYEEVGVCLCMH